MPCKKVFPKSCFVTSDGVKIVYQFCTNGSKKSIKNVGCNTSVTQYQNNCCNRPNVILIHGLSRDKSYWNCLMRKLCSVANVYALDLRGHGESDKPIDPSRYTLDRFSQDIIEFYNAINITNADIVSISLGGIISLYFAANNPTLVNRLVASGTSPRFFPAPDWSFSVSPALFSLFNQIVTETDPVRRQELIRQATDLIDPNNCPEKYALINPDPNAARNTQFFLGIIAGFDIRNIVANIQAPVLLTYGSEDPYVPLGARIFLRQNITNSALSEFYGFGHNLPVLNTDIFNKTVYNFLFVNCDPCCEYLFPRHQCSTSNLSCNNCYQ